MCRRRRPRNRRMRRRRPRSLPVRIPWNNRNNKKYATTEAALNAALLDTACEPYRNAGRFAYYFARGKLRADPVYRSILELGLLLGRARVLDLGCGQGLLAAWLQAAERC